MGWYSVFDVRVLGFSEVCVCVICSLDVICSFILSFDFVFLRFEDMEMVFLN